MAKPVGRPTKLSADITARVCADLRAGLSVSSACASGGIHQATYFEWLARAEAGERRFAEFADAVTQAKAAGARQLEGVVRKAAVDDWRAAAWMLERRLPDEWSKRTELTGTRGAPVAVDVEIVRTAIAERLRSVPDADLGLPDDGGS